MHRRTWLAWTLGLATPALATPARAGHQRVQHADLGGAGWPLGDFALTDQRGRAFTQDSLRGRWTFVLLGDARCNEACAAALEALAGLRRRIAGTAALRATHVVFVAPAAPGDEAARLRERVLRVDESFMVATGTAAALQGLADDLGGGAARAGPGTLALVGPDGTLRARYLPPFDAPLLAAHFLRVRSRG